jgi:nitroimidazol reductase NimA-like FMN-containing flavoprotein (pyridoxamine 5'-phosphate oxidase superfamily)
MEPLPTPEASTPIMYGQPAPATSLLPWSWATQRLTDAKHYWVATARRDGQPHIRPVWGVWLDDGFWFSTGGLACRNLTANDRVTVHLEAAHEVVIIEGSATDVSDPDALRHVCSVYSAKYDYPIEPTDEGVRDTEGNAGPAYRVVPQVVFGWEHELSSPTRWTFTA